MLLKICRRFLERLSEVHAAKRGNITRDGFWAAESIISINILRICLQKQPPDVFYQKNCF